MIPLETLIWIHTASTLVMTGLIWFVQLVHDPLMRLVGEKSFARYQHMRCTIWIDVPSRIPRPDWPHAVPTHQGDAFH